VEREGARGAPRIDSSRDMLELSDSRLLEIGSKHPHEDVECLDASDKIPGGLRIEGGTRRAKVETHHSRSRV